MAYLKNEYDICYEIIFYESNEEKIFISSSIYSDDRVSVANSKFWMGIRFLKILIF